MSGPKHWESICNAFHDVVLVIECHTLDIVFANKAAQNILDYPLQQLYELTLADVLQQQASDIHETIEQVMQGSPVRRHELLFGKDSNSVWMDCRYTFLSDEENNSDLIVCVARDLNHKPTSEERFAEVTTLIQKIIDSAPIGIFSFDRQGRVTMFNREHLRINHIDEQSSPENIIGMPILESNATIVKNNLLDPLKKVLEGHAFDVERLEFVTRNNMQTSVRMQGVPLQDSTGAISGGLVLVEDISNRVRTKQDLEHSEQRYRMLVSAVPDMLFRIDREGTLIDYEDAGMELYAEPEDFLNRNVSQVFPPDLTQQIMGSISAAHETGDTQIMEYGLVMPDGPHDYEARFRPVPPDEALVIIRDVTAEKETERNLKVSEKRYRTLVNAIPDLIFRLDQKGRYLDFRVPKNQGFYEPDPGEILGRNIEDMIPQEASKTALPGFAQALETGELTIVEYAISEPGGLRHYECRFSPNDEREVIAVVRDITERKKQETLLQSIALATNLLLEASQLDSSTLDKPLGMLGEALNADRVSIYELRQDDPTELPKAYRRGYWGAPGVQEFTAPAERSAVPSNHAPWYAQFNKDQIIQGPITNFPPEMQTAFHDPQTQSLLLVPIFDHTELWGFLSFEDLHASREWTGDDISALRTMAASIGSIIQRHRIEEKLRQERNVAQVLREISTSMTATLNVEKMFGLLLKHLGDLIAYDTANVMIFRDERIQIISNTGYDRFGISSEEISQITFNIDDMPILRSMLDTRQPVICSDVTQEPNWVTVEQTPWIQSWIGAPIMRNGQVLGFFSLDSAKKNSYDSTQHLRLIELVAQQASIAYEKARLFNDLQDLEHVKSRMIHIASHDLHKPLARIRKTLNELEPFAAKTFTPEQLEQLAAVWRATDETDHMVRTLLSVERIEEQHRQAQIINWTEMIVKVAATHERDVAAKGLTLHIDYPLDLFTTRGDPVQLSHALDNLLQNAVKYTPSGGAITIRAFNKDYGGQACLALEVHDTGDGIPPHLQSEIFKPAYRAHFAGSTEIPGSGMGLSVVKDTIEAHNGRVYFDSIPGEGSLFGFWLPV